MDLVPVACKIAYIANPVQIISTYSKVIVFYNVRLNIFQIL